MVNGIINFDDSVEKTLLALLLKNPYFKRGTDEIGETTLIKWIIEQYKNSFGQKITKQEILGFLLKMVSEDVITRKSYGTKVLVLPTRNFFLIKQGKEPVNSKTTQINRTKESLETSGEVFPQKKPIEEPSYEQLPNNYSYKTFLISRIASRPPQEQEIIKNFPNLYSLACNILNDDYTDWHTKMMISTALSYYILEEDIIPDNIEHGYIDDLFILCYVLREIKKHVSSNIITSNWDYEENIMEMIDTVYAQTREILGKRACDVLHKVGLWKFKRLELEEYHGSSNEKIEKLVREKRELLALVAYMVKIVYHADISKKNLAYIKQYLKTFGDHDEINRLILIASQGYDIKEGAINNVSIDEDELETKLQDSLIETLLGD
ncbi:MAG: DUF1232 domain-containing protein [Candidatus Thermoplasmatota archaeon]|nr:DUF1232 domain-containing protein [Candidatus Thermoplasmatota archaeon]